MKNKINFITGETYTLSELFSGNRRIIIPDLQRDYCWGNAAHTDEKKELVSGFVDNLINQFDSKSTTNLNLGLIYGYEAPETHIQLCDGQQRITTLFLLIGMLNRKTKDNVFRQYLISDFELHDDKEPYLQYSIRESSLYFLSDLVDKFFLDKSEEKDVETIYTSNWFFNEYKCDPSITSMLKALKVIELKLDDMIKACGDDWAKEFGEFLISKLTFMYYDMENRQNGEETYVIINTTGEPLSATQNLKPLVINAPINENYSGNNEDGDQRMLSQDWEEIETWFWQNRCKKNNNDTADAGFNEFLRWITIINLPSKKDCIEFLSKKNYIFPVENISFKKIYGYWRCVRFLFDEWKWNEFLGKELLSPQKMDDKTSPRITLKECFYLLPLIAYCYRRLEYDDENVGGNIKSDDRNILRLYKFLHNLCRTDNIDKNANDLIFDAIQIGQNVSDIIEIVNGEMKNSSGKTIPISNMILTNEEREKLKILEENPDIRDKVEQSFWDVQDENYKIWAGEIMPIIAWSKKGLEERFDLELFEVYRKKFNCVFKGEVKDIVRRALITYNLKEFPCQFRGRNYSFGLNPSDWKSIITNNVDKFKDFFDKIPVATHVDDLTDVLKGMISEFMDEGGFSDFAKNEYLLDYCQQKNIRKDEKKDWLLIKRNNITSYVSIHTMHLFHRLCKKYENNNNWRVSLRDEDMIVIENENYGYVVDTWYDSGMWIIKFFKSNLESMDSLNCLIDSSWSMDESEKKYCKKISINSESKDVYIDVCGEINRIIEKCHQ